MRLLPCAAVALLLATACVPTHPWPGPAASLTPDAGRCRVGAVRTDPLVTEWPASEKSSLEAQLRHGGVAVEYTGCAMRVLTRCRLGGDYAWQRTSPATDSFEIRGEDELWAKLPLGAAALEGELSRSGKLKVKTRVSGQLRLDGATAESVPRSEDCARATHVVGAVSIGAFSLESEGTAKGKAELEVQSVSAGGKRERGEALVRSAGDPDTCSSATDREPHADCRSPIQVFLWPIAGRAAVEGPAGTVRAELLAGDANGRWDVLYDDEVICTTPCSHWVDPSRPILLRSREDGQGGGRERVMVPDLWPAADSGSVRVVAHPANLGRRLTGMSIGGTGLLALMMGGMIALADCGDTSTDPFLQEHNRCGAGQTTAAIGAIATGVGAWLFLASGPRIDVQPGGARPSRPWGSVTFGPGFVAGGF
jgi:hypothetical protein